MKQQATRELFAYWNGLRGQRTAPERSEIDPAAIRNVLADTFMLDVDLDGGFPFRLAGTRVNGLFDAEQKGAAFLDLWRPEERRNVAAVLLTVADGACPVVAGGGGAPRGHEPCGFEVLLLPLRHFGKTHARILGLIRPAEQPAWLGLLPLGPLTLRSLRIVDDAKGDFAPTSTFSDIRSPPLASTLPCASTPPCAGAHGLPTHRLPEPIILPGASLGPGKPHLRLIEGGRP